MTHYRQFFLPTVVGSALLLSIVGLAGCGADLQAPASAAAINIHGHVHGGNQPVDGATIQLYAATTGGYGVAATPLISKLVKSQPDGSFTITGDYKCPASASQVYIVATGGNPGLTAGTNNGALALMTALGSCAANGTLSPNLYISINEVTTVAAVYALAPFMSGYDHVGTSPGNTLGLSNAFLTAASLADISTGTALSSKFPVATTAAATTINLHTLQTLNSMADVLASCINSDGSLTNSDTTLTNCGTLFGASPSSDGTPPMDTITSFLNIAKAPGANVAAIYGLVSSAGPFQPTLPGQPNDFILTAAFDGGGLAAAGTLGQVAVDASGDVWVSGAGNVIVELSPTGAAISSSSGYTDLSLSVPFGLAIDSTGDVFVANQGNSTLSKFGPSWGSILSPFPVSGGGLSTPFGLAVDSFGNVWAGGYGTGLSEFTASGTAITTAPGYYTSVQGSPYIPAADPSGDIWSGGYGGSGVTDYVYTGSATPPTEIPYSTPTFASVLGTGIDAAGNIWFSNSSGSGNVIKFDNAGSGTFTSDATNPITVGGISSPTGLAIDGLGNIWIASSGGYAVSEITNAGDALSGSGGYRASDGFVPGWPAIDASGNVWIANNTTNPVISELIGAAAPVTTPLAVATQNNLLGTRP